MFNPCSCGFDLTSGSDGVPYSVTWHAEHKAFHLAAQPDVDAQTRNVLDECVSMAKLKAELYAPCNPHECRNCLGIGEIEGRECRVCHGSKTTTPNEPDEA